MAKKSHNGNAGGVAAVALKAGVSKSTVSRAFNFPEIVKEEVRKKIFEVAAELNYRPHPAARALRSQRTHIIGAAIPTLDYAIFARMINEFQSELSELGASTIVITTGFNNKDIYENVRQLVDRGAEALLLVGEIEDEKLAEFLENGTIPAVTTYSFPRNSMVPAVGFDNYLATSEAVDHLIELGHRNFAMIASNPEGNDRQRSRIAAYQDKLRANDLKGHDRIYTHTFEMRGGMSVMGQVLADHPETTAVVCNSDVFAIGAIAACRKAGRRVPEDISIIGCDDFDFAELLEPPLTTIAVPAAQMGRLAARSLRAAITERKPATGKLVSTVLRIRGSTGPAPGT